MKVRKKKIGSLRWMMRGMLLWMISLAIIPIIIFTDSCSIFKKQTPKSYMESAKKYSDKKDYKKALRSYTKAIELDRSYFIAYWERSLVEIKMDSLEKAIDDMGIYIESMKVKESEVDRKLLSNALMQRADILFKKGYKSDACDDLNLACELSVYPKACDNLRIYCK